MSTKLDGVEPRWFDDWAIITHSTNHGDTVKVISLPHDKNGHYLWTQETSGQDPVGDIILLLESALYELTNPTPYSERKR